MSGYYYDKVGTRVYHVATQTLGTVRSVRTEYEGATPVRKYAVTWDTPGPPEEDLRSGELVPATRVIVPGRRKP